VAFRIIRRWWLPWLIGLASAGVFAAIAAVAVIYSGLFNTTASAPHIRFIGWLTHTTMIHSVRARAGSIDAPDHFTPQQVREGFVAYQQRCVACHGGPATARADWAGALTPTPPYLLDAARRWSPAELYWIVRDGVKMTAMPAWGEVEPDSRVWSMVAFLEALPDMAPADYLRMQEAFKAGAAASPRPPESSPRRSPRPAPSRPAVPAPAVPAHS
jgi:mono/diheme cytochrome c family protein